MKGSLRHINFALTALFTLVLGFWLAAPLNAQVAGATLTGNVTDASGAVVPGAKISIKNTATGVTRDAMTNSAGLYSAPNLTPGNYEVTATASGFSTEVRTGITLTVGAQQVLNLTMQVGQVTQQIQVTGAAPTVQLATSSISATVNSTTVRNLPLNGRSWTDLATLQPGVYQIATQPPFNNGGSDRGARGFGQQLAINGARPQQNNYRLDGVSMNDFANGGPGSILGGNLGVDAIQEFSVLTTNYSAEYGKTSGGVVNAITRSGTNQFHGDAYEFIRNDALDAANFFENAGNLPKPPFRRNQFGVSAGGPIQKDRTFIFGDYESIRQALGTTAIDFVPSAAAHAGILSTGNVTVDPKVQKFLGLYPLPNAGLLSPDVGKFTFSGNQVTNENFFTIRADRRFSDKDSIFATYMYDNTPYSAPDAFNNVGDQLLSKRQIVVLEETHIFSPSFVNSARFGFNRLHDIDFAAVTPINPLSADPSLGAVPGRNAPIVNIGGGFTSMPGGVGSAAQTIHRWNAFQGYDDAFLTKGLHSIKFGAAVERDQENLLNNTQPSGVFTFGSLTDFLTNNPTKFQSAFPGTLTERGLRQTIMGLYVQDDWRAHPNLTLNLGLRYERSTVPTEVQGKIATLINLNDAAPQLGGPYFQNPTNRDFQPRVGFAWDPFHNGKTAVRGGFGMFDVLPMLYQMTAFAGQSTPFFLLGQANSPGVGSFPGGALSLLGPHALRVVYAQNNPKRNYVMQWNLNIQHQITPSLTGMIGYVGSRGVHQPFRVDDADLVIPTETSAGYLFPSPVGNGTRINTHFGDIRALSWPGNSFYHGLEVDLQKRMSHGFQVQGSFTWSKSIDTSSATLEGDAFQNSISSLQWFDMSLNRGLSEFNVGRTVVINGIWDVPGIRSASGVGSFLTNGWQLGLIFTANDGVPFTPTWGTGADPSGTLSSDDFAFPDRLTGPGCTTLSNPGNPNNYIKTQCFTVPTAPSLAFYNQNCDQTLGTFPQCFNLRGNSGRNVVTGPGIANLNFSLVKNIPIKRISENFNIQFRAEAFNILNRANFYPPVTPVDIFDGGGAPVASVGQLTTTTTPAREIQFALKVIW